MKAIAVVVEETYGQLGQAASVFLAAESVEDTAMTVLRSALSDDLASTFRPPSARISGDPGASIALGRFNLGADGRLSVVASFVQEDGADRGCTQYTLDREGDDWTIGEAVDAWPNCPISSQGEESYHDALARARSGECLRLGTQIGACGPWLYVVESSGFDGTESYFDPQTGLIVGQRSFTDTGPVFDFFVFGQVDCEPVVTETIACDECRFDADCEDDGSFCTGVETCVGGVCESRGDPCPSDRLCNEDTESCDECQLDADCDDGLFCNGAEACDTNGDCQSGTNPCADPTQPYCVENEEGCPECEQGFHCDECAEQAEIIACTSSTPPDALCTADYDPVCGEDGSTYSNVCEACRVVNLYSFGECPAEGVRDSDCRAACEAAGGVWQVWGISAHPSCNLLSSDAGTPCTDSGECEGQCITDLSPEAMCDSVVVGQCSEFRTPFGCFCFMHEGQADAICID